MSHLIAISIGPVQDFIAAARRTNDLYAGSQMLQDIVGAAAQSVADAGGTLIFPSSGDAPGANKILASIPNGDPRKVCADAEAAAKKVLTGQLDTALAKELKDKIHEDLCRQQVAQFLEFFAAWWPWDGQDATYAEARQEVERLLAGRKALRDFSQPNKHLVTKSPLDPSRDTVISGKVEGKLIQGPLWLKPNEWLDAVSLLKRLRGAGLSVPSTVDVAAETFLATDPEFKEWIDKQNLPRGVVFKRRRDELLEENRVNQERHEEVVKRLGKREPNPYFAILVADGDRMGARIAELRTMREHIDFSTKLSGFATAAGSIVQKHLGHLVYAGGDDVLAFLPIHTALQCAAELAKRFNANTRMDMTVGLSIVHYHEPLYLTLDLARAAERAAKENGRNRLRVEWHTRGGQSRAAEHSWENGFDLQAWLEWQRAFDGGLTRGFAYELATLGREAKQAGISPEVLQAEAGRIYDRKEWEGKPADLPTWGKAKADLASPEDLVCLSDLLILMQGLAAHAAAVKVEP